MAARDYFDVLHGRLRDLIRWRWFGIVNSVVVLALLFYVLSHRLGEINWRSILSNTQPGWIVCALAAAVCVVLASALRTHDIFTREAGRSLGLASIVRLQFVGLFMTFAMPISVAVEFVRIGMYRMRYALPLEVCTRAVIFDRLLGALGIVFVGVLTFALQPLYYHYREPSYLVSFQIAMVAAAAAFIVFLVVLSRSGAQLRWWPLQVAVRWMSTLGRRFTSADFLLRQGLYAVLYVAAVGLVLYFLTRAFGFDISPMLLVAFTPLILFVSSLPFLYAGWGGRELIVVVTLSGVGGARADEALVLSIAYGLVMLVTALPGAVFWIVRPTFRKAPAEGGEPMTTRPNQA